MSTDLNDVQLFEVVDLMWCLIVQIFYDKNCDELNCDDKLITKHVMMHHEGDCIVCGDCVITE